MGDQLLSERTTFKGAAEVNGAVAASSAKTYLFKPNSFEPLAFVQNDAIYYYHLDHLGTPQEITNQQGELVWAVSYRAYGNLAVAFKAEVENNLRFAGQYFDEESGLHYNRFRYYDPTCGRFINQDPIGLLGGINNYLYVPNPAGWVDPLGLACKELEGSGLPGPEVPTYHKNNFTDQKVINRQADGDEVFYKYHGKSNRLGKTHNYVTKKKYTSEVELRNDLAILDEWGIEIDRVTTFKPQKGTWVSEGTAAPQTGRTGEFRGGGGYQGLIDVKNLPKSTVLKAEKLPTGFK